MIIGTDADIDNNTIDIFSFIEDKIIVVNQHKHYLNTEAYELENRRNDRENEEG